MKETLEERLHIFDLVELGLWEQSEFEGAVIYRNFKVILNDCGLVEVTFMSENKLQMIQGLGNMNNVKGILRQQQKERRQEKIRKIKELQEGFENVV